MRKQFYLCDDHAVVVERVLNGKIERLPLVILKRSLRLEDDPVFRRVRNPYPFNVLPRAKRTSINNDACRLAARDNFPFPACDADPGNRARLPLNPIGERRTVDDKVPAVSRQMDPPQEAAL